MIYNEKNIKLLYFSPYLNIKQENENIIFYNYIYNTFLKIENIPNIINIIENGINLEKLKKYIKKFLKEDQTEELIDKLIIYGVIE